MKYIVFTGHIGMEDMDIFTETSSDDHARRAEKLGILDSIISAGYLNFDVDGNVHCYGDSNSLTDKLERPIENRGEIDEKLFRRHNSNAVRMEGK